MFDGQGFGSTFFLSTTSVTTYLLCLDTNWSTIDLLSIYFEISHLSPVSLAKCVWYEHCQYILIRPVTPVLQTPVPPLQRAADVTPVFNQILMNEQEEEYDGPPQKEIPALIVWTLGGKNVYVEGSWDNWKSRKAMQKSGKDYSLLLVLPSGVYRYRFVVDGERRCLPDLPCETDAMGNAVNLLDVNDFVPESVESVAEFEAPPSPDSSYSFQAPEEKDFAKEPPALPSQLHLGVLNSQNSEESCARPQHIVLNHLFIEKGWGAHPLVALGLTHRFESKYVTVVLYKPIER
ncbi:hypothetical protein SORBI_3001G390500 [Sorghum bicolor]|uniref:Association with the SNF1 complex (ASC) domain-containing protein n=1 Tax=Sorghum bicolor TaxID=4558 RepID=A0A1Z5S9U2_SORBI|nr:hypothetical protein SORBI_3001G390500 [Sorghum bicolor]